MRLGSINAIVGVGFALLLSFLVTWAVACGNTFASAVEYPSPDFTAVVLLFVSSVTSVAALAAPMRASGDLAGAIALAALALAGATLYGVGTGMYFANTSGANCDASPLCNQYHGSATLPPTRATYLFTTDAVIIIGAAAQFSMLVLTVIDVVREGMLRSDETPTETKARERNAAGTTITTSTVTGIVGLAMGILLAVCYALSVTTVLAFPGTRLPEIDREGVTVVLFALYAIPQWVAIAAFVYSMTSDSGARSSVLQGIIILLLGFCLLFSIAYSVSIIYALASGDCGGIDGQTHPSGYVQSSNVGDEWCTTYYPDGGPSQGPGVVAEVYYFHAITVWVYMVLLGIASSVAFQRP